MSRLDTSTSHKSGHLTHPFLEPVQDLFKNTHGGVGLRAAIYGAAKSLKYEAKNVPRLDLAVEDFKKNSPEQYAYFVKFCKELKYTKPEVKHRPPPNKELYGRIAPNTPCVDIGSGDQKRLVKSGLDIVATERKESLDIVPVKGAPSKLVEWKPSLSDGKVVTSFNALTQGPELPVDCDGLHIFPNTDIVPKIEADVTNDIPGSVPTFGGYNTLTTFKSGPKRVFSANGVVANHHHGIPRVGKKMVKPPDHFDVTTKYNGVCCIFNNQPDKPGLWTECGTYIATQFLPPEFVVQCELVGGDELYVTALLRVGPIEPFNSPSNIRAFLDARPFELTGFKTKAPGIEPGKGDGLVFHSGLNQYLVSDRATFDLDSSDEERLGTYIVEQGLAVKFDFSPGCWEYVITEEEDGTFKATPGRERPNKGSNDFCVLKHVLDNHSILMEAQKTISLPAPTTEEEVVFDQYLSRLCQISYSN